MEDSLQIHRFNETLTAEEFAAQIESKNVPAVFTGCVKDWKAFSKWNVSSGGLEYLQGLAGSSTVEAMLSRSAPVFNGDIRRHERVLLPFSTFMGYCKDLLQFEDNVKSPISKSSNHKQPLSDTLEDDSVIGGEAPEQIYLAQVPIMNLANEEKVQLESLREDIEMPPFLEGKMLASVNLWMNNAKSRSTTHYDPHHNLLCIVSGCKQVILWPPSACPFLYPLPLHGEASNHSAIPLEKPDFSLYPRAKSMDKYSQKVILHAGDALFIPEGWFHQVDSGSLTIAINFWWRSDTMSHMLEHMDAYYLRRLLKRLMDKEMDRMLYTHTNVDKEEINDSGLTNDNAESLDNSKRQVDLAQKFIIHELEPQALHSLHMLVSLIHDRVGRDGPPAVKTSADQSLVIGEKDEGKKLIPVDLYNLEDDPIARIIWTLEPCTFRGVFLSMAHNFPRTLEALVLHALSPVGVEVLTRKFEQIDKMFVEEDRSQFYQKVYGVFDNQSSAMDAFLNGKESFAFQALKNVLVQYLGLNLDGPKPFAE